VPPSLLAQLDAQRDRLAAISLPPSTPLDERKAVENAVAQSFVYGFRWVMSISALLALASALGAWFMIGAESSAGQLKGQHS
jgi:hypothetical protein